MTKKNLILSFALIVVGSILSGYFGPWWAPSLVIILMSALLHLSVRQGLLLGSLSLGITFLGMTLLSNAKDEAEIISKIGAMLGGLSSLEMIVITTLIGTITGLLSGWLGSVLGDIFKKS